MLNIFTILLALVMALSGGFSAEDMSAASARTLTLGNIAVTLNDQTFTVDPSLTIGAQTEGDAGSLFLTLDDGTNALLPIRLDVDSNGATLAVLNANQGIHISTETLNALLEQSGVSLESLLEQIDIEAIVNEILSSLDALAQVDAESVPAIDMSSIDKGEPAAATYEDSFGVSHEVQVYTYSVSGADLGRILDGMVEQNAELAALQAQLLGDSYSSFAEAMAAESIMIECEEAASEADGYINYCYNVAAADSEEQVPVLINIEVAQGVLFFDTVINDGSESYYLSLNTTPTEQDEPACQILLDAEADDTAVTLFELNFVDGNDGKVLNAKAGTEEDGISVDFNSYAGGWILTVTVNAEGMSIPVTFQYDAQTFGYTFNINADVAGMLTVDAAITGTREENGYTTNFAINGDVMGMMNAGIVFDLISDREPFSIDRASLNVVELPADLNMEAISDQLMTMLGSVMNDVTALTENQSILQVIDAFTEFFGTSEAA